MGQDFVFSPVTGSAARRFPHGAAYSGICTSTPCNVNRVMVIECNNSSAAPSEVVWAWVARKCVCSGHVRPCRDESAICANAVRHDEEEGCESSLKIQCLVCHMDFTQRQRPVLYLPMFVLTLAVLPGPGSIHTGFREHCEVLQQSCTIEDDPTNCVIALQAVEAVSAARRVTTLRAYT